MKTVKMGIVLTVAMVLCLGGVVRAMSLEELIIGEPPPMDCLIGVDFESAEIEEMDPTYFVLGIGIGPDVDNPDNEFSLLFGYRHNMFEFGPTVHLWPGSDADPAWGVYALRHLSYEPVVLGKPFLGFNTTVTGNDGMYAFVAGTDVDIAKEIILRTVAEFRTFEGALAASHKDESDKIMVNASVLYRF